MKRRDRRDTDGAQKGSRENHSGKARMRRRARQALRRRSRLRRRFPQNLQVQILWNDRRASDKPLQEAFCEDAELLPQREADLAREHVIIDAHDFL